MPQPPIFTASHEPAAFGSPRMTATDRDRCSVSPSRSRTGEMFRLMPERETWRKIVWIVSPGLTRTRIAFNDCSISDLLYFMVYSVSPLAGDWCDFVSAGDYLRTAPIPPLLR